MGFLDKLRDQSGQHICMNVCMMGPRGVGKTTILTAIFNETQNAISSTRLMLHAKGDTHAQVSQRYEELLFIFDEKKAITDRPVAGLAATRGEHVFDFAFGLVGKKPRIDLHIKDFPGEYVQTKPKEVTGFIAESNAIMIAIDTPHMMEAGGRYCEARNRVQAITSFFKESLSADALADKLVLLVPLKCERYQHEGRMSEVLAATERYYAELLQLLGEQGNVCCAITPILTLGGVEFDHFEQAGGEVGLSGDLSVQANYRFWAQAPSYRPAYCTQPMYYLLSFVSAQYQKSKKEAPLMKRLMQSLFGLFDKDPELYGEVLKMERFRKNDFPGYKVVCGESMFYYNR